MKLLTEVKLPEYPFQVGHRSRIMMMGSCFTENIGRMMERSLFPVTINPFGTTYNPLSVMAGLKALIQKERYGEMDLKQHNGRWFSFDHYTGFSSHDKTLCLDGINEAFIHAKKVLRDAQLLVITWGTAWVYRFNQTGEVVSNCHKIPASQFTRTRLATREIIKSYETFLPELFSHNPNLKILLTVSPVRHWKDGAHGNQLSKATLLLATEALAKQFPGQVFYFPSYEIVMDELRDYRFYAPDMLHTSQQATAFIWEKFRDTLISGESQQIIKELEPLVKLMGHRPLDTDGEAHQITLHRTEEKLGLIKKKYPFLTWERLG